MSYFSALFFLLFTFCVFSFLTGCTFYKDLKFYGSFLDTSLNLGLCFGEALETTEMLADSVLFLGRKGLTACEYVLTRDFLLDS